MNTKAKGESSTGAVIGSLLKIGFSVLFPFSDNQRYDLVIEKNGAFKTVQCKTGRLEKDGAVIIFKTCSYHYETFKATAYTGQIDYFGVYCPQNDKTYLVPVSDVGTREGLLRLKPMKKKNSKIFRDADNYELKVSGCKL